MAEILGVGVTHYPMLLGPDERMADLLRWTLEDPDIPGDRKDPSSWPAAMREEWGDDGGTAAAARHRAVLRAGFRRARNAIDAFRPDVVVVWGDDQYENFREDVVPAFSVLAYDDFVAHPWKAWWGTDGPNAWGEDAETGIPVRGHRAAARHLVEGLLDDGVDVAYAYRPLHHDGWAHAFLNTLLYLDWDRTGFDHPMVAFPVNCYGRAVITHRGSLSRFAERRPRTEMDPPSPTPMRCYEVGRATAEVLADSPWRVALVASSSWSHAFLTDKTWRLWPDHDADRALFDALRDGDYRTWRGVTRDDLEESGQQELLNWFCLVGAMEALDRRPSEAELVETHVFNSNKCFAVFPPEGSS